MAREVPTCEPSELVAGDSWEWDRSDPTYPPSDGWTLTYYFNGPAAFNFAASTSDDGDYYEIRQLASTHAAKTAGTYKVLGRVSDGTDAFTVYEGTVKVVANYATASATQSHDETVLAVIDSALSGRLTADLESYQINGRQVSKIPVMELVKLQGIYRSRLWQSRHPGKLGRTVEVRFGNPA